ncbi:MAG: HD domain-containing protein [Chloroflexi bacterium]|nr:HD domain-containing protein [Chloroflexota bacterium]
MAAIDALQELFETRGAAAYLGERVSVATHMLQAGALAQLDGAPDAVVAAALLHDVGHLVAPTSHESDAQHETRGADWLAQLGFPRGVTEPVRLHVAAKRYLCATEPEYFEMLSPASKRSLVLQGGPMLPAEVEAFAQLPHAEDAVAVRRWDEAAKDPDAATPALDRFRQLLEDVLR